jgi:hypothetical protein
LFIIVVIVWARAHPHVVHHLLVQLSHIGSKH